METPATNRRLNEHRFRRWLLLHAAQKRDRLPPSSFNSRLDFASWKPLAVTSWLGVMQAQCMTLYTAAEFVRMAATCDYSPTQGSAWMRSSPWGSGHRVAHVAPSVSIFCSRCDTVLLPFCMAAHPVMPNAHVDRLSAPPSQDIRYLLLQAMS